MRGWVQTIEKYEGQPRDRQGQFASEGSLGQAALAGGGFSVSGVTGARGRNGWMVSQKGTERTKTLEELAGDGVIGDETWERNAAKFVKEFRAVHESELSATGVYLGGWVDEGKLYLDVSHNFPDDAEAEARSFAADNEQKAMFNAGSGEYVRFDKAASKKVYLTVAPEDSDEDIAKALTRALFG